MPPEGAKIMPHALEHLHLTESSSPKGLLVKVQAIPDSNLSLDEQSAVRLASTFKPAPDHILFRRFSNGHSSQVAAYVIDKTARNLETEDIAELYHAIWSSGSSPLLYVGEAKQVQIFSCMQKIAIKNSKWNPKPFETIDIAKEIGELQKRFSAFRLIDGTFWNDPRNKNIVDTGSMSHKILIEKVNEADRRVKGNDIPIARHLLLISLLLKYLEDREVIPATWFEQFVEQATSCYHIFNSGDSNAVLAMLDKLHEKFNGDIFKIPYTERTNITRSILLALADAVQSNQDAKGQIYFWGLFSFKYIPVEVISHIYQRFADRDEGAVYTPPLLVNLMLDYALPCDKLNETDAIFDPSCGSGIFLVSAFRRLIRVWSKKRAWAQPTPKELKQLLSHSIFGIELQSTAAELTSFSLALAICDALQPEVIWNDLQFDKIIGTNILIGDFAEELPKLVDSRQGNTFNFIVGNPPFKSKLTPAMKQLSNQYKLPNHDNQAAYLFLLACLKIALSNNGTLCLLQNAGCIYNETPEIKTSLFQNYSVEAVLDFVSIRGLFADADTKVIAILAKNTLPKPKSFINHLIFRRTQITDLNLQFELDYYDYCKIPLELASTNCLWVWKINLLGGGRLFWLMKDLMQLPNIETVVRTYGWTIGEGFIEAKGNAKNEALWLTGMELMPTDQLGKHSPQLSSVEGTFFATPRAQTRYDAPLLLIKKHTKLPSFYRAKGKLAYKNEIVGINAPQRQIAKFSAFVKAFEMHRKEFSAILALLSSRHLISRATVVDKKDIAMLPWFPGRNWEFSDFEKILLYDVVNYMNDYARLGQKSKALQEKPTSKNLDTFTNTYISSMKNIYPQLNHCGAGTQNGLRYQAFSFTSNHDFTWGTDNWAETLYKIIYSSQGNVNSFSSIRVLRYYEDNLLILVKPDVLRYWLGSVAIRDADDTLADILQGE